MYFCDMEFIFFDILYLIYKAISYYDDCKDLHTTVINGFSLL